MNMPKTLQKYVEEFGSHLISKNKSEATIFGYKLAIKQFLCDIVDNRGKDKDYKMVVTPKTLTYKFLEQFTVRAKSQLEPNTQKIKLAGIKRYLKYIRANYNSNVYETYEKEKELYNSDDEDILRAEPIQDNYKDTLSRDEVKKFFDISKHNPRNHAILKLFYYTSQRIHSIVNLNQEDIDFTPKYTAKGIEYYVIKIRYLKGKKQPKDIPVSPDCIHAIQDYLEEREEPHPTGFVTDNYRKKLYHKDALFLNGRGKRIRNISIYAMISRYSTRLQMTKRVHPHLFRHSAISIMDVSGMTDAEKKGISGHSKLSNAIDTYKNPVMDNVVEKSLQALDINQKTPKPTPNKPDRDIIPKPQKPIETPIQQSQSVDKETRLFNAYKQGLITKQEYLKLMDEEITNDSNLAGYY